MKDERGGVTTGRAPFMASVAQALAAAIDWWCVRWGDADGAADGGQAAVFCSDTSHGYRICPQRS